MIRRTFCDGRLLFHLGTVMGRLDGFMQLPYLRSVIVLLGYDVASQILCFNSFPKASMGKFLL